MCKSGSMEERLLIRDRYSAYSDAVFQQDKSSWLDCWCDDGTWIVFGKEISGKQALTEQWDATWSQLDRMAFFSEIGRIEVQDQQANVRSYCHEIVAFKNGKVLKVVGEYTDQLTKVNDVWRFSLRRYTVLIKE